jgi:hypothetical protein
MSFFDNFYTISILSKIFPFLAADNMKTTMSTYLNFKVSQLDLCGADLRISSDIFLLLTQWKLTVALLVKKFSAFWIFHYSVYIILSLNFVLGQMNPFHGPPLFLFDNRLVTTVFFYLNVANAILSSDLSVCVNHTISGGKAPVCGCECMI